VGIYNWYISHVKTSYYTFDFMLFCSFAPIAEKFYIQAIYFVKITIRTRSKLMFLCKMQVQLNQGILIFYSKNCHIYSKIQIVKI